MYKKFFFSALLFASTFTSPAREQCVYMKYHRKTNPGHQTQPNRAPVRVPIDVVFDSETGCLYVSSDEAVDAEIYLLDSDGNTVDYSPILNCEFSVSDDVCSILIISEGWYAEGFIEF